MGARGSRVDLKGGKVLNRHVGESFVVGDAVVVITRMGDAKVTLQVLAPPTTGIGILGYAETQARWAALREELQQVRS